MLCVLANLVNEGGSDWHRRAGYVASAIVVLRCIWGVVGPRHARFADWWPTPARLLPYLRALLRGQAPRMLGHNPAGAVMMLVLLMLVMTLGLSGYMMGSDAFWGEEWLEELHEGVANTLIAAVSLHVLAAIIESIRHRENLPLAMINGYKRAEPTGKSD